jgi:hypothetical protein
VSVSAGDVVEIIVRVMGCHASASEPHKEVITPQICLVRALVAQLRATLQAIIDEEATPDQRADPLHNHSELIAFGRLIICARGGVYCRKAKISRDSPSIKCPPGAVSKRKL